MSFFCKNLYKNYDLFLAYKANIAIFLFFSDELYMLIAESVLDLTVLLVLPVVSWEKEASIGNWDF